MTSLLADNVHIERDHRDIRRDQWELNRGRGFWGYR